MPREKTITNAIVDITRCAQELMETVPEFLTDGTRTIFLLERAKDGGHNKEDRRAFNFATYDDAESLEKKLIQYLWLKELYHPHEVRIYISVNARNLNRATRNIHEAIITAMYSDATNQASLHKKICKGARSYLMDPNARETNYFLLDVDNQPGRDMMGETLAEMARLGIMELHRRPTRNGWHIITLPFNPATFNHDVADIKKDGLLLLV